MKIDRLSKLISAFNPISAEGQQATQTQAATQVASQAGSEAVTVSRSLPTTASNDDSEARARKVQDLKQQVADGTYKPSSEAVARSVAADLFA